MEPRTLNLVEKRRSVSEKNIIKLPTWRRKETYCPKRKDKGEKALHQNSFVNKQKSEHPSRCMSTALAVTASDAVRKRVITWHQNVREHCPVP